MKKFLLSTSAIVGIGLIAAPAGAAERIKLSLGGYANTFIGFSDAEDDARASGFAGRETASHGIHTDKEVHFSGSTKLDNGISIAVRIELEASENQTTIDESYVTISSDTLGRFVIGGDDAAQAGANVNANKGISNDYDNWIAEVNATTNDNTYDVGNSGDSQKITYWAPRYGGFQLGGSYVPNTSSRGATNTSSVNDNVDNHSAYSLSLTWNESIGDVGVNSQVAMYREGLAADNTEPGQTSYNAGLRLAYQGFDAGIAWLRSIQSMGTSGTARSSGYTFQTSLSYSEGPWKAGVYRLYAENQGALADGDDETEVYTVFGTYDLSDGVQLRGMVFNVDYDEETNVDQNELSGGWGVVAGMALNF